ncbi:MAG TPA: hypothetical protein VGO50_04805 [Pyrinomonadaceae bacterium]|jgi:hypothetical protein|nr:hypothetical protein [Pyrinomonadaceae bacterium]
MKNFWQNMTLTFDRSTGLKESRVSSALFISAAAAPPALPGTRPFPVSHHIIGSGASPGF